MISVLRAIARLADCVIDRDPRIKRVVQALVLIAIFNCCLYTVLYVCGILR